MLIVMIKIKRMVLLYVERKYVMQDENIVDLVIIEIIKKILYVVLGFFGLILFFSIIGLLTGTIWEFQRFLFASKDTLAFYTSSYFWQFVYTVIGIVVTIVLLYITFICSEVLFDKIKDIVLIIAAVILLFFNINSFHSYTLLNKNNIAISYGILHPKKVYGLNEIRLVNVKSVYDNMMKLATEKVIYELNFMDGKSINIEPSNDFWDNVQEIEAIIKNKNIPIKREKIFNVDSNAYRYYDPDKLRLIFDSN